VLRPASARSNLPLLTIEPDDSVFASGDITKDDTYWLEFSDVPPGVTAIRLEVMPDDRLPAHGPGMAYYEGPKGDFFLGEFELHAGDRKLGIAKATESYSRNHFGQSPVTARLATDGDPQTGWSCAGRYGERHQAVFVLSEPFSGGDLTISMRFGRHYACSLGRFRIGLTTNRRGGEARDLPEHIEMLLKVAEDQLSDGDRQKLFEQFLMIAPELASEAKKIRDLRQPLPITTSLVLRERPSQNPRPTFRHHRGEFLQPKERVQPGVPSTLLHSVQPQNRLEFARWLASPGNPLTARVTVNYHWSAIFGHGLVRTPGDFGTQGDFPTHPELLDWLASEFMSRGWSVKQLHRLMVTSATYRQTSRVSPAASAKDPQNRLLSRSPRFRLDAELIRDAALRSSNLLSETMYGPPVRPPQPEGVTEVAYGGGKWETSQGADRYRRSLYTFMKRTAPFAMLTTFDAPSGEVCMAARDRSNTPLQALTLLNDPIFIETAQQLGRMVTEYPGDDKHKAVFLFRRCLTRPPDPGEIERIVQFVQNQRDRLNRGELEASTLVTTSAPTASEVALWSTLARAMLNLDEAISRN
jgi:hypothetical protein